MLRSASSFFVLSLLALQVALAKTIENGVYLIQDGNGRQLGVGPIPDVYPPLDAPLRVFNKGNYWVEKWRVEEADDGTLTIATEGGANPSYNIITKEDYVFVSARKEAENFSVTSVGGGEVEIKLPYKDQVFTTGDQEFSPVTLEHAQGLPSQKWKFIRVDKDLYHRNRFCVQESW